MRTSCESDHNLADVEGEANAITNLRPRQRRFIQEYLVDLNATAAYKRAGYRAKNDNVAAVEGHRLLRNPKIRTVVKQELDRRMFAAGIKGERVLREAAYIALADPANVFDFREDSVKLLPLNSIPEHAWRTIASIRFKDGQVAEIRFWSKIEALDKLFKHLGLFDADNRQKQPTAAGLPLEAIDELELPLDVRITLLDAIKRKRAAEAGSKDRLQR